MDRLYRLDNRVQAYAWGSKTAIAGLLGQPIPSARPQAELWMGAHPRAPSMVMTKGGKVGLDRFIEADPGAVLGKETAKRFGNRLPYLFKVLAAGQPLSIQAHPSRQQAMDGFARENRLKIPLDAPRRNYRDANHKPECLCALTRFWGMCGFRTPAQIAGGLAAFCPESLKGEIERFRRTLTPSGINDLFATLMTLSTRRKGEVAGEAAASARRQGEGRSPEARWIARLHGAYPEDVGVISPLLLNLVCVEPGRAIFLPAGQLHAYLEGTGIELMANSDNVLRGGLTPKHVDVAELMRVLSFDPFSVEPRCPMPAGRGEKVFQTHANEFCLSMIRVDGAGGVYLSPEKRSIDILLCTAGAGRAGWGTDGEGMRFSKGESLMAPAAAGAYRISGDAALYKASVPLG